MKPRILYVDDEEANLRALARALRKEPFELLTARSAAEALELLERTPVDVVVSDERMPGMSGSEFLNRVCKKYPETVRIILTGYADFDTALRAINEGEVYRFLKKPIDPTELALTLHQAIKQKEMLRKSRRALRKVKQQAAVIEELERETPGITRVERDPDGTIVVEDVPGDMNAVLEEILNAVEKKA